jgi:formate/nitrite transporter FocA (FNT family)
MNMIGRPRNLLPGIVISMSMIILMMIDIAIHEAPGRHDLADFITGGLFFGLIVLLVYINSAELFTAEKKAATDEKKDHHEGPEDE